MSIWDEATGSLGGRERNKKKKKKRNQSKSNHVLRVTLKTIWPRSQQDFEEELREMSGTHSSVPRCIIGQNSF